MNEGKFKAISSVALVLLDIAAVVLAFAVGYWMRATIPLPELPQNPRPFQQYLPVTFVHVFGVVIVFYFSRLYHLGRVTSRFDQAYAIFGAVSIATMFATATISLLFKGSIFEEDYPRGMIAYAWLLSIIFVFIGREFHRWATRLLRSHGIGAQRVIIVGTGEIARTIVQKVRWSPYLGYRLIGVVNGGHDSLIPPDVPYLGHADEIGRWVDEYNADSVIIALPEASHQELVHLIASCQRGRVDIKVFPDVFTIMAGTVTIDDMDGMPMLSVRDVALRGWKLSLKRAIDIIGATAGLIVLSPPMLLTAIVVKLTSTGPAFYCQERMGLDGHPFMMIKFRSMRIDAETQGPGWTTPDDPRKTQIGDWMRRHNWDEIPQLINVLLGEMSLVGPRPERPFYVEKFRQDIPRYMERHREKAGMTGWAQVNGLRGDTSIFERTKYDLWYIENWSIWLDIKIILRTIWQTIFGGGQGAY